LLPDATLPVPASLLGLLTSLAPLFTAPSFRTFFSLACGFLAQTGKRTVCGMLAAAGLGHERDVAGFVDHNQRVAAQPGQFGLQPSGVVGLGQACQRLRSQSGPGTAWKCFSPSTPSASTVAIRSGSHTSTGHLGPMIRNSWSASGPHLVHGSLHRGALGRTGAHITAHAIRVSKNTMAS
jgi:hypothetical protein